MDLSDHTYFFKNETRRDWEGFPRECCPDCDNFEGDCSCGYFEDEYDGQPDEAQGWCAFDPDCGRPAFDDEMEYDDRQARELTDWD